MKKAGTKKIYKELLTRKPVKEAKNYWNNYKKFLSQDQAVSAERATIQRKRFLVQTCDSKGGVQYTVPSNIKLVCIRDKARDYLQKSIFGLEGRYSRENDSRESFTAESSTRY